MFRLGSITPGMIVVDLSAVEDKFVPNFGPKTAKKTNFRKNVDFHSLFYFFILFK